MSDLSRSEDQRFRFSPWTSGRGSGGETRKCPEFLMSFIQKTKQRKISMIDIFGPEKSCWILKPPGQSGSSDFQLAKVSKVSKKMMSASTWGCNQCINGSLQNKNHQEWKDVRSLSSLFRPTNLVARLTNAHIPCWCTSASYITKWLSTYIFFYQGATLRSTLRSTLRGTTKCPVFSWAGRICCFEDTNVEVTHIVCRYYIQ